MDELRQNEIYARILDAAEECLMQSGLTARVHAAIAERAGLSRPTLYKYVGDQSAILDALLDREVSRFFSMLQPVIDSGNHVRTRLVDMVVFIVDYARHHELLQKGLREEPHVVLGYISGQATSLIDRASRFLTPHLSRHDDEAARQVEFGAPSDQQPIAIVEWAFRLVTSLITTPGVIDTQSPEALRRFVSQLLSIASIVDAEGAEGDNREFAGRV